MRSYRKNSHSQYDKSTSYMDTKYRKRVLIGKVAEGLEIY
ncbi:hypothetical protein REISMN_00255 [Rickettsia tamurae subsp. buchneri]|uniref:Uncharacterized protein n=1 Tax=Rickettsia tamurae subsp. buchneri TaxID=1462938 RepID=A0A8E0WN40_9RICK|nr:hypothetical protein REISMN_00255 [Rickettsia tamurae subsp. buchneri]